MEYLRALRVEVVVPSDGNIEPISKNLQDMFPSLYFKDKLEGLLECKMNKLVLG